MSTLSTRPMNDFVVLLDQDVIAPVNVGIRISGQALVVPRDELSGLSSVGRAFENTEIAFDLDRIGGLSEADNDDNWGAGPLGYNAQRFWSVGVTGRGVRIGIADSGIDVSHPTFNAMLADHRLKAFAAFAADGSKIVQHAQDGSIIPDSSAVPTNTHWHGTFCAAVLVGATTEGKLRGIAPQAELVVVQVLQQGNVGTVASIQAGLSWLADQKCDVISLSLGWDGKHDQWAGAMQGFLDQGAVVIAAAGNSFGTPGVPPSDSPGNYPLVSADGGLLVCVGSINQKNGIADDSGAEVADWSGVINRLPDGSSQPSVFSSSTSHSVPTMVAPGVEVVSARPGGGYRQESGTSMATPQVAGLIALVLSKLRDVRPTSARTAADLVLESTIPLVEGMVSDRSGRGKISIDLLFEKLTLVTQ
jgi:subtilisin family serine protease